MEKTFKNITFSNFLTLQRGFDLPKQDREPGAFPVVASTSIQAYHSEYKVKPPGVVTGRSGSLGSVQYIEVPFWPLNTTLWVKDFKGNDPKFVFYFLQTLGLERYNSGAGVPTLNRNHLDSLDVSVPLLSKQRKIAAILSAYDDLIENNLRRIKILEEMAQNLYREWFVKFRFPGHEKVKMVDSPVGRIPEGWEVKQLDKVCGYIARGVTPKYLEGSGKFIINQKSNRGNLIDRENLKELAPDLEVPEDKLAKKGDILVNSLGEGTIGRVHYFQSPEKKWAVDQHMTICRSKSIGITLYLFSLVSQRH